MENHESNEREQTVFKDEKQELNRTVNEQGKTSSGMDENVAGFLCYLVGFVTGIIFLVIEKENRFVRFHAMQSIITFGALFVVNIVLSMIPILGWLLMIPLVPLTLIIWIILMIKAYNRQMYKLPVVGNIAEKQLEKLNV